MRIDLQISPIPLPSLRLAAKQCVEPATHCSRPLCTKPSSPEACDRYEPGLQRPLLYADYLEKQNQRKPALAASSAEPSTNNQCGTGSTPKPEPADTSLGPKLGDIPAPKQPVSQHERIVTAYQVQRFAPAGSLVDVLI